MIRVYTLNKDELENIEYTDGCFSAGRLSKIDKLKRDEDKNLSRCAELLLIYAAKTAGAEFSLPMSLKEDDNKKLFFDPPLFFADKRSELFFNLSHSGDYAACAVSDSPVGIDIEYFRPQEIFSPKRILHPKEFQTMEFISNPREKKKYFYECWVLKESFLKNLGIGLLVRPDNFMIREDTLIVEESDKSDAENLKLLEPRYAHAFDSGEVRGSKWKFDAGYKLAVCSQTKDKDLIAREVHAADINSVL